MAILFVFSQMANASPQQPELLILGGDTIPIYHLPLEDYFSVAQNNFFNDLRSQGQILSATSNWRGYQGMWSIENERLYFNGFKHLITNDDHIQIEDVLNQLFHNKIEEGKVFADWYSSKIVIPKGELLRWDGVFSRTYQKEEILTFNKGVLVKRELVDNYIPRSMPYLD